MLQLLFDFFSGRAKTRIYTTFLGWVLVFHIDIIFIAMFTDQAIIFQKTEQLKGEYVWSYITSYGWWTVVIEAIRLILATMVTYLMIWVIPKLMNEKSYKEELEVEYTLRQMKIKKDEALNKKEENVVRKQLENIKSEKKVVVERAKLDEAPEQVKWDMEYEIFKNTETYNYFDRIIRIVYRYGGDPSRSQSTVLNSNIMAYLDTNEIISLDSSHISFTGKGRYFVKKHTEAS